MIYIVFKGSYSDRGTAAVFDNETAANNYIENARERNIDGSIIEYDDWDIETWEVNSECPLSGRIVWRIDMNKRGDMLDGSRESNGEEPKIKFHKNWNFETASYDEWIKLVCICNAEDLEHAVKITNEKRVMLIASGEWDKQEALLSDD